MIRLGRSAWCVLGTGAGPGGDRNSCVVAATAATLAWWRQRLVSARLSSAGPLPRPRHIIVPPPLALCSRSPRVVTAVQGYLPWTPEVPGAVDSAGAVQSDAQDLSRSLHLLTHLAYEPRRLLGALEGGLPHTARLLSRDMHTSVKVLMCIATFDAPRPRLHAWTMHELSHMDGAAFSGSLMQQVIQAHVLAEMNGCGRSLKIRGGSCGCTESTVGRFLKTTRPQDSGI